MVPSSQPDSSQPDCSEPSQPDYSDLQVSPNRDPSAAPQWIPPTTPPHHRAHEPLPPPWPGNVKPPDYDTATAPPPPPRRRRVWLALIIIGVILIIIGSTIGGIFSQRKSSPTPDSASQPSATPTSTAPPPNPTSPLPGTALTIPQLSDNTTTPDKFSLFYQALNSSLLSLSLSLGSPDSPVPLPNELTAVPLTPLAALAFTTGSGGTGPTDPAYRIHIFYISPPNFLADATLMTGIWTPGTIRSRSITPVTGGRLAASVWEDETTKQRSPIVFYQVTGGHVVALGQDTQGKWAEREGDVKARVGCGFAASYTADAAGQSVGLYMEGESGGVVARTYNGSWGTEEMVYQAAKNVSDISVVGGTGEVQVFFETGADGEVQVVQEMAGTWGDAKSVAKVKGGVAATRDGGGTVRVFFQEVDGNGTSIAEATGDRDGNWTIAGTKIG